MRTENVKHIIKQCESIEEIDKFLEVWYGYTTIPQKAGFIAVVFDTYVIGKPIRKYTQTDYEIVLHTVLNGGAF